MEKEAKARAKNAASHGFHSHIDSVIDDMIKERERVDNVIKIFKSIDKDHSGSLDYEEFVSAYLEINSDVSLTQLRTMFQEADLDGNGTLELDEVSYRLSIFRFLDQPNQVLSLLFQSVH